MKSDGVPAVANIIKSYFFAKELKKKLKEEMATLDVGLNLEIQ